MTRLFAVLALISGLAGCVVAPYGYDGYGYGGYASPAYGYYPAPAYYAAPIGVGVGVGFGGGWHGR
jgi:hypothetical protein